MSVKVVGCSHHDSAVEVREKLAFTPEQVVEALNAWKQRHGSVEAVLLSTCNRVELYSAAPDNGSGPEFGQLVEFLASFHHLDPGELEPQLFQFSGQPAVKHLFSVAASLDSMVVGEAQILSQVKQAFTCAQQQETIGSLLHHAFDSANRVAKRVATETAINRRRVSVPSVAVADYAKSLFETFDDKNILLIGAGDMGEETLHYLRDEGARQITIVNRSRERAEELAERVGAVVEDWDQLMPRVAWADLIVSTTGARRPIVTLEQFRQIEQERSQRLLFVLDLAVPRDFDGDIGSCKNVYLYCVDDLQAVCEQNRKARKKEWPKAERIIEEETDRFVADLNHRATGPTIRRLREQAHQTKQEELDRLMNKVSQIDGQARREIERSFDRLVNKLLHPPLDTLRDESQNGTPHGLLDALRRLFQIPD